VVFIGSESTGGALRRPALAGGPSRDGPAYPLQAEPRRRGPATGAHLRAGGFCDCLPAFLSPACEWNVRVGANSPSLCPTMFSVTNTGTNFRPLCTANVRPTASGMIVERRDQVLIGFLSPELVVASIFLSRWPSMNG